MLIIPKLKDKELIIDPYKKETGPRLGGSGSGIVVLT